MSRKQGNKLKCLRHDLFLVGLSQYLTLTWNFLTLNLTLHPVKSSFSLLFKSEPGVCLDGFMPLWKQHLYDVPKQNMPRLLLNHTSAFFYFFLSAIEAAEVKQKMIIRCHNSSSFRSLLIAGFDAGVISTTVPEHSSDLIIPFPHGSSGSLCTFALTPLMSGRPRFTKLS